MKTYEALEKLFGVRLVSNLTNPRIIDIKDLSYPKYPILISRQPVYSNLDINGRLKIHLLLKDRLADKKLIGRFRRIPKTLSNLISDRKKIDNGPIFLHSFNQLFKIPRTHLGVIDYSMIDDIYKYQQYPRADIDKYNNILLTIVDELKEFKYKPQQVYLIIDMPDRLITYTELKVLLRLKGKAFIDRLDGNYKLIDILELIKLLIDRENSIFNIDEDLTLYNINLLFRHNNKITMFRLSKLASISIDNPEVDKKLKKYTKDKAARVFYKYLLLFILNSSQEVNELKRTEDLSKVEDKDIEDKELDLLVEKANNILEENKSADVIDDIKTQVIDKNDTIINSKVLLSDLKDNDLITETREKIIAQTIENNAKDIEEIENFDLDPNVIPDSKLIPNKDLLKDVINPLDQEYLNKIYLKQQKNVFIKTLNNAGIGITNFTTTIENTLTNKAIHYSIDMQLPNGSKKLNLIVPLPDKKGYMVINGKEYRLRKQYLDIPFKKINSRIVSIMSYNGKVFVSKGVYSNYNIGDKLYKELLKMASDRDSHIKMVVTQNDPNLHSVKLPLLYTYFSRKTRSITTTNEFFLFDYLNRDTLINDTKYELDKLEKGEYTLVGITNKNIPLLMDKDGIVYEYKNNNYIELNNLIDYLEIDRNRLPIEYASMKILGKFIPVVYTLILYYGLDGLLRLTNTKYRVVDERVKSDINTMAIRFEDKTLLIDRNIKTELLFGALVYTKDLKLIKYNSMNLKSGIKDLFFFNGYDDKFIRDLTFMRTNFIDSVIEETLKYLKLPTTLEKLILKALELLEDDNYENPNNITTFMFKGYERINGMINHILYKVLRDYNRKLGKVTATVNVSPYELYTYLNNDSTFILVEDVNPIKQLQQKEEFTMTGMFGRTKDTVTMKDRVLDPSAIGVISEATKDSSDVGITAFLSATPSIDNLLGLPKEAKEINSHNIFSSSALLGVFSHKDDGKRTLYTGIQNQHVVPIIGQSILPIMSGYELILPYKVDEKYAVHAKDSGRVLKVTKKYIEIQYDDGEKIKYNLNTWFSKEVGGTSYKHQLTTMLKDGDRFKAGDNIIYDETFFGPIYLEKNRVAYKWGELINVFYTESPSVFEDSSRISKKCAEKFTTMISSVRDKILSIHEKIIEPKNIGDKVVYNDALFIIAPEDESIDDSKLNSSSISILKDLNRMKFKAKTKGVIKNIEIFYNCELEDINSTSLLKLIKESDKRMKEDLGVTGKVNSKFSYKGRPLEDGEILIIYYIEKPLKFLMGDKISIGLQLKTTNGGLFNRITTESGIELDMEFGETSDAARIVLSPLYQGMINRILLKARDEVVKEYYK